MAEVVIVRDLGPELVAWTGDEVREELLMEAIEAGRVFPTCRGSGLRCSESSCTVIVEYPLSLSAPPPAAATGLLYPGFSR